MKTAKVSDYRNNLANFHKNILLNHDPLRISGLDGDVVVVSAEDFDNLIENVYVAKDKSTMKSINETRKSMKSKKFKGINFEEAFSDLLDNKNKQTSKK